VNTLKNFLNGNLDVELNADGIFDAATTLAVNAFQLKYWEDVLAPWVPFGLPTDHTPTGYVYKTTSWKINQLNCDANGMDDPIKPILP
jgi:peptidoglycan hydrolase-like protein with peptidoglycan-binding domain